MGATTFKVAAIFEAFDKMSAPIRNINNRLNQFQKKMKVTQATVTKSAFGMAGSIRSIATGIIGASVAFAVWDKVIVGTIKRGAELEATLLRAGARFGKDQNVVLGTKAFQTLKDAVVEVGLTTEFTSRQAAAALDKLAAAGLKPKQAVETLRLIGDFATAAGLDMERAASISVDAIGAFGQNIQDLNPKQLKAKMNEINDIMVITANSFNTSVEQMFEASTKGGRVLTRLIQASGFEFAAFVGQVANTGLKAEVAGTGLRAGFIRMASGVPEVNKAMRKLGIRLTDNNGKMRGVADILEDVRTGMTKVKDESKKLALFQKLFGRVGINVMEALQSRTKEQFLATVREMENQRGEVKRIATEMRRSLIVQWTIFLSKMDALGQLIFDKISPGLKLVVKFLNQVAASLSGAANPLIQLITLIIQITIVTKAWAVVQFLFNKALAANPLFFIISALIILTTLYPEAASKILEFSDVIVVMTIAVAAARLGLLAYRFATTSAMVAGIAWRVALIAQNVALAAMPIIMAIVTAAQWAWNVALTANPIGIIIVAIGALIAALVALVVFFPEIVEFFTANWFDVLMLLNPFTAFLAILGKIFPDSIGKMLTKVKNMFTSVFSAIGDFIGFGDDEQEIDVNKTSNVNFENAGRGITPSPAAVAAAEINGRILVDFNNKPADVTVSKPGTGSNDDGLILLGSGA